MKHLHKMIGIIFLAFSLSSCASLDMDRYEGFRLAPSSVAGDSFTVTFLGNTNILIEDGTTKILTDGYFTRAGLLTTVLKAQPDLNTIKQSIDIFDLENLDYIIPLHHHFDHVIDAPALSQLTGAEILGTNNTLNVIKGWSNNIPYTLAPKFRDLSLSNGGDVFTEQLGEFNVTFIRGDHMQIDLAKGQIDEPVSPPVFSRTYKTGDVWILLVTHERLLGKILIVGSAGNIPNAMKSPALLTNTDIVFMAVPGIARKSKAEQQGFLNAFVTDYTPTLVVPVHWDDLFNYKINENGSFALKPHSALTNTIVKTQKSINSLCEATQTNSSINIALFTFGQAYSAKAVVPSNHPRKCDY